LAKPKVEVRFPIRIAVKPEVFKILAHHAIEQGVKPNDYLNRLLCKQFNRMDLVRDNQKSARSN